MTNLNNLVDEIYLINLEKRTDRYALASKQLDQICSQYTTIRPVPNENPKVSFNETCLGIMKGVVHANEELVEDDIPSEGIRTIAVFEDDFELKYDAETCKQIISICMSHLAFVYEQPTPCVEWDILYLGANLLDGVPEFKCASVFQIFKAWTTHAVIYNIRAINYIARNYKDTTEMFDAWLSKQIEAGELNAFITSPMVAWQRPDKSDIWGVDADYTQCFIESEKKLR